MPHNVTTCNLWDMIPILENNRRLSLCQNSHKYRKKKYVRRGNLAFARKGPKDFPFRDNGSIRKSFNSRMIACQFWQVRVLLFCLNG